ncbi:MAG: ABC transporter permease, partial [Planctomycetaceae bacterium]
VLMASVSSASSSGLWLPVWSLMQREIVRFLRQRSRLTGALLQPVIFWVLFGTGLSGSFRMPGGDAAGNYQAYFLPGIAAMIVMFTAIFSAISVIQDRNEGFLQGVLASPASRLAIVLGKVGGGATLAVLQGVLFLLVAPLLRFVGLAPEIALPASAGAWLGMVAMLVLIAVSLCGLGYALAWRLDSVQGFHAVMSVLFFPMWLLSGAFFPVAESGWLGWLMRLNPLTYGVAGLRQAMSASGAVGLPGFGVSLVVMLLFTVFCLAADVWLTHRPRGV